MAVTRKPKPAKPQPDESTVQALISRGGSVAEVGSPSAEPEYSSVLLRIPSDMLARIDAMVKSRRPVRISRQAWIIETLHERLTREV